MSSDTIAALTEQLAEARREADYYRKLSQECGARRLKEAEELSGLIEQLRQTELVLVQARDDAEAANRAKTQFLATMSHELRTPLTAIIGYSQMMEQLVVTGDYSTVASDLHHIYSAGRHLLSLINDVLDLTRIEAGSLSISAERVHVPHLIDGVISTVGPLLKQNHNTLQLSCPEQMVMMYSDPLKVRQVLLNLLGNASKFTDAGVIRLTVSQERVGAVDWISFAVADSGIGIAADQMPKLFKTFSQLDDSLNRRYGGAGLGLALSRRLCQLLGGEITVESAFGVGSVFTMRLPAIAPTAHVMPPARPPAAPISATAAPEEEQPVVSENIVLVIDDDLEAGGLIAQLFGPERAYVVHATSGAEGIELARDILPDLILLDVLIDDIDAWQVLARLKADPESARIPVVLIGVEIQRQRGLALGVATLNSRSAGCLAQEVRQLPAHSGPSRYSLIIEDDSAVGASTRQALEGAGWRAVIARTGFEAMSAITTRQPDLIVLDLLLPDIDGLKLIDMLYQRPSSPECPILIMSPGGLSDAERAQLQSSAHQILAKGEHALDGLAQQLHSYLNLFSTRT